MDTGAAGNGQEARWDAVLARDRKSDGRFVFAVRTTGIYCRPSCPARRPRRQNVLFFEAPGGAEQAGFRPCRRCRPEEEARDLKAVAAACRTLEASGGDRVGLADLARGVGLSPGHLRRVFQASMGVTPRAFADALRLKALRSHLREGDMVTGSLYEVGYGSSSRLYEASKDRLGMTPATYRKGGAGTLLSYSSADSPMGRVLVAVSERGLASISLGSSEDRLVKDLHEEFPRATIRKDEGALAAILPEVLERVSGNAPRRELPMDVRATAFQRRVWDALLRIPRGETRTYGQLAREIHLPRGSRAVARACATNPLAVVIPCHRVVGGDGRSGGYRWGAERKKKLLTAEGAAPRRESTR